jgi:hypothetical protein
VVAEVEASVAIWGIRADDISLTPNEQSPRLLRLHLGEDVRIVVGHGDEAEEAAAMRRLIEVATEAAEELERRSSDEESGGG